ncbi:hypothetical protein R3P38DRAFT_3258826 [Favolaschia claudopus]|uniref:Uncharacterized protein n=1 Tax=Favolaschia claudopus TaxID=2862362 RepID=A0AAW0D320_9AGAR
MQPALNPPLLTRTTVNGEECAPQNPSPPPPTPYASPSPPPFTPASLHFTLGFLYTGTLIFSHCTYLSTALALLLSAFYLALPTFYAEVSARIKTEMAHGLCHAALPFTTYEKLMRGPWCAAAASAPAGCPASLSSPCATTSKDAVLERGSRRALVGLFGTVWCAQEFFAS